MTSVRGAIAFCGEGMDDASEATLTDLRTALERFINDNARYKEARVGPDYAEDIRKMLRSRGQAEICEREAYRIGKLMLQDMLRQEFVTKTRKRLESPSDPRMGDCL